MATKPRTRSKSGFYHVFHRGVNHFDIFENDGDREFYLDCMKRYARKSEVEVHAWCLMSNHVHLLVRTDLEQLSGFMRKLGSVYARYFNRAYGRIGPLFGGRFSSVCVETDAQLVSVVRYIHRNPVCHDRGALFGDYQWSSYGEYLAGNPLTCELAFVLELFGSVEAMARFHEERFDSERERHLDIDATGAMKDDEARRRANSILEYMGFDVGISFLGTLSQQMRDRALFLIRRATGCSLRQLQRLTAIAYAAIRKAVATQDDRLGVEGCSFASGEELAGFARFVRGIGVVETGSLLPVQ